jgi:hypothetical protein
VTRRPHPGARVRDAELGDGTVRPYLPHNYTPAKYRRGYCRVEWDGERVWRWALYANLQLLEVDA